MAPVKLLISRALMLDRIALVSANIDISDSRFEIRDYRPEIVGCRL
jgi:hypothetical protein